MEYSDLSNALFEPDFYVPIFDELERENLKVAINALDWDTSYKLFNEVFSENSKYMTVHQAKGLEWEKVIVSVIPNIFDKTNMVSLYSDPQLLNEHPAEEFVRMYYVACSRAKEDLYIHIPSDCDASIVENAIKAFMTRTGQTVNYEIIL